MILAIAFAHVWGVIQLIVLGSLARTVRVRTLLAALAVGLYAVAPLTLLLQMAWTRPVASLTGISIASMVDTAGYTVDPFIEETMKVLPLAALLLLPAIRRQWSFTDCALMGGATGSGFGLAEHLYRYSANADGANAVAGGWIVAIGRSLVGVPSILTALTRWLPMGARVPDASYINIHLAWSVIGGLAVGLIVLNGKRVARVVGVGLFLYIGLDHGSVNAPDLAHSWLAPFGALADWRGVMAIAALAAAWMLDRDRQRASDSPDLLLAAERAASSRIAGTFGAAFSRLPWSLPWVDHFVRARRTYYTARALAPAEADGLLGSIVSERDRVDRALAQIESPPVLPSAWTIGALRDTVRQPMVIVWLVLMAPSVLWFVVGGWPPTARIQTLMIGPIIWKIVSVLSVVLQVWVGWNVIVAARAWSKARLLPVGDDAAIAGLRIACGVGAVGLGGFAIVRMFDGLLPGSSILANLHVSEAANRLSGAGGSMLAGSAGAFAAPPPTLSLPDEAAAAPSAPSPNANAADAGQAEPQGKASTPKAPDPAAAARDRAAKAASDADAARDRESQAERNAVNAADRYQQALRDADAADIAKETADPESDPAIAAARERARQAHDKSIAADAAAAGDDIDDPWGGGNSKKAAADAARAESQRADADQRAAENDFWSKKAADADAAKAAVEPARADAMAAENRAAEARDTAHTADATQHDAESNAAREAARTADPAGAAADDAAANYAAAQKRVDEAFFTPEGAEPGGYSDALKQAELARQRAEEAKTVADAAHAARPSIAWKDKP